MEARLARLETHTEHNNANVADLRAGLARLEVKVDQGFARLDAKMEQGFARVDAKFGRVDERFERMDARFERMDTRSDRQFMILGGMIVSLGIALAGLMAKGFHWL